MLTELLKAVRINFKEVKVSLSFNYLAYGVSTLIIVLDVVINC